LPVISVKVFVFTVIIIIIASIIDELFFQT